jgi:hypothetical protein
LHRSAHANSGAFNFLSKMAKVVSFIFSFSGSVFQPLRAIKDKRKPGDVFDDSLCANGWRWEWVSVEHEIKCHGEVVRRERVVAFSQTYFTRGRSMRGVQQTNSAWQPRPGRAHRPPCNEKAFTEVCRP